MDNLVSLIREARYDGNVNKTLLIHLLKRMKDEGITTEEQRVEYALCTIQLLNSRLTAIQSIIDFGKITQSLIDKTMRLVGKITKIPKIIGYDDLSIKNRDSIFLSTIKTLLVLKEKIDQQHDGNIGWIVVVVEGCFHLSFAFIDFVKSTPHFRDVIKRKLAQFNKSEKIEERNVARKFDISRLL